jgi:tRNA(fMet)-specific endonuclease VapC
LNDFRSINILGFDLKALNLYQQLKLQKIRIGTQDLKIAAVTLSENTILVTRNKVDFEKVPALIFQDWSV